MIEVNNLTDFKANESFLKKIAQKVLAKDGKNITELSIALVGEKRITELNKKYRKKDKPTDVLSFLYDKNCAEIVICPVLVKKNELPRILIHGLLHILGYEHEISVKKAKLMQKKEQYYLSQLKILWRSPI